MIANIKKVNEGYVAIYERLLHHSIYEVWAMLTDNDKLKEWFPELKICELREGGHILFDMQNGTFEEMAITKFKPYSILEFTWAADIVRFELYSEHEGCLLVFKEKIKNFTSHTPRDLAGWHVCLGVIQSLLEGRTIESRKTEWEKWYDKYVDAVNQIKNK